jgi:hypothetical protein
VPVKIESIKERSEMRCDSVSLYRKSRKLCQSPTSTNKIVRTRSHGDHRLVGEGPDKRLSSSYSSLW